MGYALLETREAVDGEENPLAASCVLVEARSANSCGGCGAIHSMRNNFVRLALCAAAAPVAASVAATQPTPAATTAQQAPLPAGSNPALPEPAQARLSFEEANALASHPRWLSLRYAEFDTSGGSPALPEDLSASAARPGAPSYFLVQFLGPIGEAHRLRAAEVGVELLDYVPNHAFIARGTPEQRAALGELVETVWTGEFHPAYRLDERLHAASENAAFDEQKLRLVVLGFQGVSRATLGAQLAARGLRAVDGHDELGRWLLVVEGTAKQARALARARDVQWIEPEPVLATRNNNMTWTVQSFINLDREVWDRGILGDGQIIGHIDGSIALGSCYFADPGGAPVGPTHRKVVYNSGSGTDAHGTHTAGSAAGDSQPVNGSTSSRGIAYRAKLAHTTDLPTTTFSTIAGNHRNNGARTHTNSWGDDTTTAYNTLCNQVDSFSWNNEDNLVLFAATNGAALRNPENAKNLVAVGASQNGTSANGFCSGGTGPTADGRRKPEVFAPGCGISSASGGACGNNTLTGTSMAAPAATGAAALIRQYFMDGFYPSGAAVPADAFTPTGALVKAVLINCTQNMTGISGYPSDQEGWGRIVLDESLYFTGNQSKLLVVDVNRANGLTTGQTNSMQFTVVASGVPLELTLAFHDAPGTVNASNPVINDLDLVVTSPSNQVYRGNVFSGGVSVTGGNADAKNNVERVALANPQVGAWTVEVIGANVPQSGQGYGLCITGDIVSGGGGASSNPTNYCTSGVSTGFCQPTLISSGVAVAGASTGFSLIANDVDGARLGVVFYGVSGRLALPWPPGSGSFLCVNTPLQRTGSQNSGGTAGFCNGALSVDWSAFVFNNPAALGNPFSAGQLVNSQVWYRDAQAPGGANLTGGLEFTVQP